MGNMREHDGVRCHGDGPCRVDLNSFESGNVAVRIGGQGLAVQQHDLAMQVAIFRGEMVFVPHGAVLLGKTTRDVNMLRLSAVLLNTVFMPAFACY